MREVNPLYRNTRLLLKKNKKNNFYPLGIADIQSACFYRGEERTLLYKLFL